MENEMKYKLDEDLAEAVLLYLEDHGGKFFAPAATRYGHTLGDLASAVQGEEVRIGSTPYVQIARVVVNLEQMGFIRVKRANDPGGSYKANVVERIELL